MREIKFRGKLIDNGEWIYGDLLNWAGSPQIWTDDERAGDGKSNYLVIKDTVGQFTGLTDKNGKDIYEGDIVVVDHSDISPEFLPEMGSIRFWKGSFEFVSETRTSVTHYLMDVSGKRMNIIGNIHDNPNH